MTQVQKVNQSYSKLQRFKRISNLWTGALIGELSESEIAGILQKIYVLIGASDKNIVIGEENLFLIQNIKSVWHDLYERELIAAFELAIKGDLLSERNETIDLDLYNARMSMVYLRKVIIPYKKQYRAPAVIEDRKDDSEPKKPSDNEILKVMFNNLLSHYLYYKEKETYLPYGNTVHKRLSNLGLINWSLEEKLKLTKEAKELLKFRLKEKCNKAKGISQIKSTQKSLSEFLDSNKTDNEMLRDTYRELSLIKFYKSIKLTKEVYKDLLMKAAWDNN